MTDATSAKRPTERPRDLDRERAALHAALKAVFGFSAFRPGQEEIALAVARGEDVLAVMPTGAGKSLCYQLPAVVSGGLTIVVSPLIALMDNQLAQLNAAGVEAGAIHSNRPREESVADWRRAQRGELKLLYMAPERLMTPRMIAALKSLRLARIVVDEAHCVSQWGHDFRPDYLAIGDLRRELADTPFAAFTATADARTRAEIRERLLGPAAVTRVHSFNRANIDISVTPKFEGKNQLVALAEEHRGEQGIIYCLSRKETEKIADLLNTNGFRAVAYHAGLAPDERAERLNAFLTEPDLIVAATVAFGMGIDKPDIRFVFHYALPGSIEAYYQEIGRAGRDGAPARAVLLYTAGDAGRRRRMIASGDSDAAHAERRRLDDLVAFCEGAGCRRQRLLAYFGEDIAPCGACDACRRPLAMVDATDAARLVVEAVRETGETYGAAFIVDVIRGADTQKIRERKADSFVVYGKGKARPAANWRRIIRGLIGEDYLESDPEYGVLRLTAKGRAADQFEIPEDVTPKRSARKSVEPADATAAALFAILKDKRLEIARTRSVPAYVIFSDRTLLDMAEKRPRTREEFAAVFGVGAAKIRDFADAFLAVIAESDDG